MDKDKQQAKRAAEGKKLAGITLLLSLLSVLILPSMILPRLDGHDTDTAGTPHTALNQLTRSVPAEAHSAASIYTFTNAASGQNYLYPASSKTTGERSPIIQAARPAATPLVLYSGASSSSASSRAVVIAVPTWTDLLWSLPSADAGTHTRQLENIPVYPDAVPVGTPIGKSSRSVLEYRQYSVSGNSAAVLEFYERTVTAAGWTPTAAGDNYTRPVWQERVDKGHSAQESRSTPQNLSGRRRYYWRDSTGTVQYSLSLSIEATEYQPGSVTVDVVLQKKPDLRNLPAYPGASDVRTGTEERFDKVGGGRYASTYGVTSYAVRASPREVQNFYSDLLSKSYFSAMLTSSGEMDFYFHYPVNPTVYLRIPQPVTKGSLTHVQLLTPVLP